MNIQQFEYLIAVAELKHFDTAAEHCNISQSTLSTMISKFEDEIGIKVFSRKTRPITVTKEGGIIIKQLKAIVYQINILNEIGVEIKGGMQGTIKIGIIPTIAPFLLPLFLKEFALKYPELIIELCELTTSDVMESLKCGDLDLGIVSLPIGDPSLIEIPLYNEPFLFYDESQTYRSSINVSQLNLDNFWVLEEGHCMKTQVLKICELEQKKINSALNIIFKAGSIDSLLRMVKANNGKTILPYLSTLNWSEEEKMKIATFKNPTPMRTVGILVHEYFVKTRILQNLQLEIQEKIMPLIANLTDEEQIIDPL